MEEGGHHCGNCGKEHDGSYGSGRFCSRHCRFVFIGKQTKKHVCNFNKNGKPKCAPYGTWKCCHCDFIAETRRKLLNHKKEVHPEFSKIGWNKGLTKETNSSLLKTSETSKRNFRTGKTISPQKGKPLAEEQKEKISTSRRKYLNEHPDKVPYLLNHSSKESYPEKYFKELFEKENINLKYHKQVSIYQLDFYNEQFHVYIEIDGGTHDLEKVRLKDERRMIFLESLGWKGMRIKWSDFKKSLPEEKKMIVEKIRGFLR